jgi:DNA invertase Pin-like site-specific DNA recombinase
VALTYPFTHLEPDAARAGVTLEQLEALSEATRRLRSARSAETIGRRRLRGDTLGRPRVISETAYRRAAELAAAGWSQRAIAETLTAEGHARGNGSTVWTREAAGRLLARRVA